MCSTGPLHLLFAIVVTTSGFVKCWDLAISSDQSESAESSVTIRCTAPEVAECEFSVYDYENKTDGGLLDCKTERQGEWKGVRPYSCVSGDNYCGITLSDVDRGRYVVGCRANISSQGRGWKYNYTTLYVYNGILYTRLLEAEPLRASPGDTKTYECPYRNKQKLNECIFSLPSNSVNDGTDLSQGVSSPNNGGYSYHGSGLQSGDRGECGIRVGNVSEEDNGIVWCRVKRNDDAYDVRAVALIVAKPPSNATLSYHQVSENTVLAICSSSASRPIAHIKWVDKAGSTVRDDRTNDRFVGNAWLWPWDVEATRQLEIRYVKNEDDEVSCRVSHPLLRSDLVPVGTGEISYEYNTVWLWIIILVVTVVNCILFPVLLFKYAKKKRKWCFAVPANNTELQRAA